MELLSPRIAQLISQDPEGVMSNNDLHLFDLGAKLENLNSSMFLVRWAVVKRKWKVNSMQYALLKEMENSEYTQEHVKFILGLIIENSHLQGSSVTDGVIINDVGPSRELIDLQLLALADNINFFEVPNAMLGQVLKYLASGYHTGELTNLMHRLFEDGRNLNNIELVMLTQEIDVALNSTDFNLPTIPYYKRTHFETYVQAVTPLVFHVLFQS